MGANLSYIVETEFKTKGDPTAGLDAKAKKTGDIWSKLGSGISSSISSIGSNIADLGVSGVKFGIAAGIGAATYGVIKLNNELETTKTSFAAVFSAQGVTKDIGSGLDKASQIIEVMRKDAAQLPGEFEDLVNIYQSGIGSALNAGLTAETFEKVSANAMAAGKALAVPLDMAGRELAQLLEGRAGAHNTLGTRLGIHAEGFNDKTSEQRVKIIQERLEKFQPAIAAFGKTFDAAWTSALSNGKEFLQIATQPLFEVAKDTLNDINAWFDTNKSEIKGWANDIGLWLKEAFLEGKEIIKEWGPPTISFAKDLFANVSKMADVISPLIKMLNELAKSFIGSDGASGKLLALGAVVLANKGLGAIGGPAGAKGQQVLGQGVAGFAAGQLIGGLIDHAVDSKTDVFSNFLSKIGGGAAMGAAAGPWGALAGGVAGAGLATYEYYNDTEALKQKAAQDMVNSFIKTKDQFDPVSGGYVKTVEKIDTSSQQFLGALNELGDKMGEAAKKLAKFDADFHNAGVGDSDKIIENLLVTQDMIDKADITHKPGLIMEYIRQQSAIDAEKKRAESAKNEKGPPKGSGNMNIQKVEITVSSNQAPGQIAKALVHELANVKKAPIRTAGVPNYSRSSRIY